ncbi:MAG: type IV pilin protein [Synechococcus sp.]
MNSTLRAKLMARMMKNAKGFTLIELLVVIVIVGVLSAVAVPTFLNQVRRSRVAEAQAGLAAVGTASEVYRFDEGTYTGDITDLENSYIDSTWAATAPNYQNVAGAGPDVDGVLWTASSDGTDAAYTTNGTVALSCDLGLGDQAGTETDPVDDGCNLP